MVVFVQDQLFYQSRVIYLRLSSRSKIKIRESPEQQQKKKNRIIPNDIGYGCPFIDGWFSYDFCGIILMASTSFYVPSYYIINVPTVWNNTTYNSSDYMTTYASCVIIDIDIQFYIYKKGGYCYFFAFSF